MEFTLGAINSDGEVIDYTNTNPAIVSKESGIIQMINSICITPNCITPTPAGPSYTGVDRYLNFSRHRNSMEVTCSTAATDTINSYPIVLYPLLFI